jgi:regulatory protein
LAEITALKINKGRGKKVRLFLDGRFAFGLEAELAVKEGLKVGQELSSGQVEALAQAQNFQCCLDTATRYLGYRPRSEHEMRQRLGQRGFDSQSIEAVLARLKEQNLMDDSAFARFWKDNRQQFSPRSQWLVRQELKQKGVPAEVIDQAVSTIDDADSAYRAARSRARNLPVSDYQDFRRRLGGYLERRGFGYGVIVQTIDRMWRERKENKEVSNGN